MKSWKCTRKLAYCSIQFTIRGTIPVFPKLFIRFKKYPRFPPDKGRSQSKCSAR